MMNDEQLLIFLFLFIGFIGLIVFIRCWPFKKEEKKHPVLKYSKLNLLTGIISELTNEEMKKDVSALLVEGYELTVLQELFDLAESKTKINNRLLLILNNDEMNQFVESLTCRLMLLNADIIFYKPIIVELQ
jgi:hypothetical protein